MYILEILDGDRAQSGSFWEVPKKCRCCCPIKPKKPEATLGIAPVASKKPEVSLTAAMVAQAILKKPDEALLAFLPPSSQYVYDSSSYLVLSPAL